MTFRNLYSVQCPYCQANIGFYRVKPRFSCPACKSTVGSNRSWVDVWAVLIYIVLTAAAWYLGGRVLQIVGPSSYMQWAIASAVIAIVAYCLLAPRALILGPDSLSRDTVVSAGSKKQKITS